MGKAIMLAAMHSGAGKTSITLGTVKYLSDKGYSVRTYKTGPDYIDTAYHTSLSKKACINLEPYFLEAEKEDKKLLSLYQKYNDSDICIIEAAMGYYDGIYGFEPRASAYTVANELDAKVCLITDSFDENEIYEYIHRYDKLAKNRICALIMNKCTKADFEAKSKRIEDLCKLKVLGFLNEDEDFYIAGRHLGLNMPDGEEVVRKALKISKALEENVDMSFFEEGFSKEDVVKEKKAFTRLRMALAWDKAFCFMYEENLSLLRQKGFEIVNFSPIKDKELPESIDLLWLPGGYPEVYAAELEKNYEIKKAIKEAVEKGLPTIAECGGFMYMHKSIEGLDEKKYDMLSCFDFESFKTPKLQRFGYIEVEASEDNLLLAKGEKFKTHEFHHWDSTNPGSSCHAVKANKSKEWDCIHAYKNIFAGYPHIYLKANESMPERLTEHCLSYRLKRELAKIEPSNKEYEKVAKRHWDNIAKPLDGLGRLESALSKIAAISESENINIDKKAVLVMCADNGVVEEGVSQAGFEVTKTVSENFARGIASVNTLAGFTKAQVIPVNVGIKGETSAEGLIDRKLADGTKNFAKEAAMSKTQLLSAIMVGIDIIRQCKKEAYTLLGTGEMGIGNTTTSAALCSVLLKKDVKSLTGRGAGLCDELLQRKIRVIEESIEARRFDKDDALEALRNVGGFDIAALCGVFLGAAIHKLPVVMDGLITNVAALVACRLNENCRDYILASHQSTEPAAKEILKELGLCPLIFGDFCLGEGTGATFMFSLLDMALAVYNKNSTFSDIKVEKYERRK